MEEQTVTITTDDEEETCNQNDTVLCYPSNEKPQIIIHKKDLLCLEDKEFLNDTILSFFLNYIQLELINNKLKDKIYIFNSFFYNRISKRSNFLNKTECWYQKIKKWTKGVDIFKKDFLFIPAIRNKHWFLIIICYIYELPIFKDEEMTTILLGKNRPCILIFDSLNQLTVRNKVTPPLRSFLTKEYLEKKNLERNFNKNHLPEFYVRVPKQPNDYDCGCCLLEVVENFLKDPFVVMKKESINTELKNWFSINNITNKRKSILNLIESKKS